MFTAIIALALFLALAAVTSWFVRADRPVAPPRSHPDDEYVWDLRPL